MRKYRFYQVDDFTTEPFTGNPLAVVPDADGLSDREMRRIAHEMSLPETTFVVAPRAADSRYRMRIFTPTVELPFTGHPAIGAHWVMAALGRPGTLEIEVDHEGGIPTAVRVGGRAVSVMEGVLRF